MQIAGISAGILPSPLTDARNYVFGNGTPWGDSSFGEIGAATDVSFFLPRFINPATTGNYDLVFDMNKQLLGVDGITENLTITASIQAAGGVNYLVLDVAGSAAAGYNGEYFRQPLANIQSLTIRGALITKSSIFRGTFRST
jgi:hypothetical protein